MDVAKRVAPSGCPLGHSQRQFRFDLGERSSEANVEVFVRRFWFDEGGAGALILWDPSLRMLAIAGVLQIVIVVALTLIPRPKERIAEETALAHAPAGGH